MRITFLLPATGIAGGIRSTFELANRLQERGHHVSVVYPLIPLQTGAKWYNFRQLTRTVLATIGNLKRWRAKTPCIVANTSALREWVDNENCFGTDYPMDIRKSSELINEVMGKKVREVNLWDWEEIMAETVRVYKE